MKKINILAVMAIAALGTSNANAAIDEPIFVNADNFIRAESDLYFGGIVKNGGFGRLDHTREMAPLDKQTVIRLNRDTVYSSGVYDLDAGPIRVVVPDTDGRFTSLQVISQDHYTYGVFYGQTDQVIRKEDVGTRYVALAFRLLADPQDPADMSKVHALQDRIQVTQQGQGSFEIPEWDMESQTQTRATLNALASDLPDTAHMFGTKEEVEPVRHLLGTAYGWGGNPDRDAMYLNFVEPKNDGQTVYRVTIGEVPVKSFWSISLYNAEGFYEQNALNAYNLNSITAKKSNDGTTTVQFGGCDGNIPNCLPTPAGWNWMVRLYQPEDQILNGSWSFPRAVEVQ